MRIIDIRERAVSLSDPMSNAAINFQEMTASAVAIDVECQSGKVVTGYGFSSVGRYAQSGLIGDRFAPRLLGLNYIDGENGKLDPRRAWVEMMKNEKWGGDGDRSGAVGVLDMALWDVAAKIDDVPLWKLLSDRHNSGVYHQKVPVYATGGHYYPRSDLGGLQDEVKGYLDSGFEKVKIKCGQSGLPDDIRRIEASLSQLDQCGARLAIDVNCAYESSQKRVGLAKAVSPYQLAWVEEPSHPHDFDGLAEFIEIYKGVVATGENLFSVSECQNLLRYGGLRPNCDLLQIDPAFSYGVSEYLRILKLAEGCGWKKSGIVPHAGHLLGYHVVAGFELGAHEVAVRPNFILSGLQNDVEFRGGYASLSQQPGMGFEIYPKLWRVLKELNR